MFVCSLNVFRAVILLLLALCKHKDSPFPLKKPPGIPGHEVALIMKIEDFVNFHLQQFSQINVGFIVSWQTLCKGNNNRVQTFFFFTLQHNVNKM